MKCPVCGARLYQKQICPYCKITDKQILGASNRKVKECRKTGNTDLIHYSTEIPSDISKIKLYLFTILLGWLGINHYYVLKPIRGTYSVVSFVGAFSILIIQLVNGYSYLNNLLYHIFFYMMAINVILWIFDIFNVFFKGFKIPVVLPKKGDK